MTKTTKKPSVLFVCSKNGGKSQLAAGLMNLRSANLRRRPEDTPKPLYSSG